MIYFIQEQREGGLIKIGYTESDPHGRMNAMQTGNPNLLELLATQDGTPYDERKLHTSVLPKSAS